MNGSTSGAFSHRSERRLAAEVVQLAVSLAQLRDTTLKEVGR